MLKVASALAEMWNRFWDRLARGLLKRSRRAKSGADVADTFDEAIDEDVVSVDSFARAVAGIKMSIAKTKSERDAAAEELDKLKAQQAKCFKQIEKEPGNQDHRAAWGRFNTRISQTETRLAALNQALTTHEAKAQGLMTKLIARKQQLDDLRREKHEAVAQWELNDQYKKAYADLNGLVESKDRTALHEVRQQLEEDEHYVGVQAEMAGVQTDDERYTAELDQVDVNEQIDALLAAKKVTEDATTGAAPVTDTTSERPVI